MITQSDGCVVWLTGLRGAGKMTLAQALLAHLRQAGCPAHVLDGDLLQRGLCRDLGFNAADRHENIRRAGEVARLLGEAGLVAIAAFISPFLADRDCVREIVPAGRFFEVFVNAPLATCEQRDVKG